LPIQHILKRQKAPLTPPSGLNCGEITYRRFRVTGSDPHRFDGGKDGIGCES